MTGNLNAALVLVNKLNEAYFLHRNLEIILSCFSADAHVVGVVQARFQTDWSRYVRQCPKGWQLCPLYQEERQKSLCCGNGVRTWLKFP